MFTKRIIPCLDVNNGRVVKGVNFVDLKDAGDPVEIAKAYDAAGADELVFLDITASSDGRGTVIDMVREGEILLTSMDCDGTKAGYDLELTKAVAESVSIPVIASGGAGTVEHFKEALTDGGADAALAASLFHYKELEIRQVKEYLRDQGISVRLI